MSCKKIPFTASAEKIILLELIEVRHQLQAFEEKSAHYEMPCIVSDYLNMATANLMNAEQQLRTIVEEQDNS